MEQMQQIARDYTENLSKLNSVEDKKNYLKQIFSKVVPKEEVVGDLSNQCVSDKISYIAHEKYGGHIPKDKRAQVTAEAYSYCGEGKDLTREQLLNEALFNLQHQNLDLSMPEPISKFFSGIKSNMQERKIRKMTFHPYTPVDSSNIKGIEYSDSMLKVTFAHEEGDREYGYDVGPEFFTEMEQAPSKGQYLWNYLRGKTPGYVIDNPRKMTPGGVGGSIVPYTKLSKRSVSPKEFKHLQKSYAKMIKGKVKTIAKVPFVIEKNRKTLDFGMVIIEKYSDFTRKAHTRMINGREVEVSESKEIEAKGSAKQKVLEKVARLQEQKREENQSQENSTILKSSQENSRKSGSAQDKFRKEVDKQARATKATPAPDPREQAIQRLIEETGLEREEAEKQLAKTMNASPKESEELLNQQKNKEAFAQKNKLLLEKMGALYQINSKLDSKPLANILSTFMKAINLIIKGKSPEIVLKSVLTHAKNLKNETRIMESHRQKLIGAITEITKSLMSQKTDFIRTDYEYVSEAVANCARSKTAHSKMSWDDAINDCIRMIGIARRRAGKAPRPHGSAREERRASRLGRGQERRERIHQASEGRRQARESNARAERARQQAIEEATNFIGNLSDLDAQVQRAYAQGDSESMGSYLNRMRTKLQRLKHNLEVWRLESMYPNYAEAHTKYVNWRQRWDQLINQRRTALDAFNQTVGEIEDALETGNFPRIASLLNRLEDQRREVEATLGRNPNLQANMEAINSRYQTLRGRIAEEATNRNRVREEVERRRAQARSERAGRVRSAQTRMAQRRSGVQPGQQSVSAREQVEASTGTIPEGYHLYRRGYWRNNANGSRSWVRPVYRPNEPVLDPNIGAGNAELIQRAESSRYSESLEQGRRSIPELREAGRERPVASGEVRYRRGSPQEALIQMFAREPLSPQMSREKVKRIYNMKKAAKAAKRAKRKREGVKRRKWINWQVGSSGHYGDYGSIPDPKNFDASRWTEGSRMNILIHHPSTGAEVGHANFSYYDARSGRKGAYLSSLAMEPGARGAGAVMAAVAQVFKFADKNNIEITGTPAAGHRRVESTSEMQRQLEAFYVFMGAHKTPGGSLIRTPHPERWMASASADFDVPKIIQIKPPYIIFPLGNKWFYYDEETDIIYEMNFGGKK